MMQIWIRIEKRGSIWIEIKKCLCPSARESVYAFNKKCLALFGFSIRESRIHMDMDKKVSMATGLLERVTGW